MSVLEELRAEIGAGRPVSDGRLLVGAARLIEDLDQMVAGLQAEVADLRRGLQLAVERVWPEEWLCPVCGAVVADRDVVNTRPPVHEHHGRAVAMVERAGLVSARGRIGALSVDQCQCASTHINTV